MTQNMNSQIIAALANLTRLNEGEGLLLALHPDFILAVRPGMSKDERETAADENLAYPPPSLNNTFISLNKQFV